MRPRSAEFGLPLLRGRFWLSFVIAAIVAVTTGCSGAHEDEYTLYRTGWDVAQNTADESLRVYLASFRATREMAPAIEPAKYNQANCEFAQVLFSAQQPHGLGIPLGSIKARYWCEKGSYRKRSRS